MKSSAVALFSTLSLLAVAGTAFSQTSPSPVGQSNVAATNKKTSDPRIADTTMVCKAEDQTGSRLGGKKVCLTRRQWADIAASARENFDRSQRQSRAY